MKIKWIRGDESVTKKKTGRGDGLKKRQTNLQVYWDRAVKVKY